MSSLKFFGSESSAKCGTKSLPHSTGEGRDRGAKKITPTLILPRRGGGHWNETGSQVLIPVANLKLSLATFFFVGSFLVLFVPLLSAQEKKLEPFTISYASVSGTRGPLWIAQDLGILAKYALD